MPAENCIVVAEGELGHNGVMKVAALGFPPVEPRAVSQAAAKVRYARQLLRHRAGFCVGAERVPGRLHCCQHSRRPQAMSFHCCPASHHQKHAILLRQGRHFFGASPSPFFMLLVEICA